jgi:hypothetical protein
MYVYVVVRLYCVRRAILREDDDDFIHLFIQYIVYYNVYTEYGVYCILRS